MGQKGRHAPNSLSAPHAPNTQSAQLWLLQSPAGPRATVHLTACSCAPHHVQPCCAPHHAQPCTSPRAAVHLTTRAAVHLILCRQSNQTISAKSTKVTPFQMEKNDHVIHPAHLAALHPCVLAVPVDPPPPHTQHTHTSKAIAHIPHARNLRVWQLLPRRGLNIYNAALLLLPHAVLGNESFIFEWAPPIATSDLTHAGSPTHARTHTPTPTHARTRPPPPPHPTHPPTHTRGHDWGTPYMV